MKVLPSSSGSDIVVTVGEGGFIEFWNMTEKKGLEHSQLIQTPTQSIWAVDSLSDGDVVVGAE